MGVTCRWHHTWCHTISNGYLPACMSAHPQHLQLVSIQQTGSQRIPWWGELQVAVPCWSQIPPTTYPATMTCPSPKSAWTGTRLKDFLICTWHLANTWTTQIDFLEVQATALTRRVEAGGTDTQMSVVPKLVETQNQHQHSCQDQCTESCLYGCKEEVEQVEGLCYWLHHLGNSDWCWYSSPLLHKGPVCHKA